MRGRKPKPTEVKRLTGNPGKRPLNTDEPQLPPISDAFIAVPRELLADPIASEEWTRLASMLRERKVVTEGDRGALLALCQQWSLYQQAVQKCAEKGMVVMAPSGYPIVNPYLGIANKAIDKCTKLWVELGLTPSSRSRVTTDKSVKPEADPFAQFDQPHAASIQ